MANVVQFPPLRNGDENSFEKIKRRTYIYGLICPISGQIRYVGKSNNPKRRLRCHFKEIARQDWLISPNYRQAWLLGLKEKGLKPTVVILEKVDETEWQEKEKYWINFYRLLDYKLVNSTDGGDGGLNPSIETRQRQSAHKKGKALSSEHRLKMSESHKKRYQNFEERRKISLVLAEINARDEVKQKKSVKAKQNWEDENYRLKTGAAISKAKQRYLYIIKTPDGLVHEVINLREWCSCYGYKLQSIQQVARGDRPSCHGVTISRRLLKNNQ